MSLPHLDRALDVLEGVFQVRILRMGELHFLQRLHQVFATQTVAVQQSDHLQLCHVMLCSIRFYFRRKLTSCKCGVIVTCGGQTVEREIGRAHV